MGFCFGEFKPHVAWVETVCFDEAFDALVDIHRREELHEVRAQFLQVLPLVGLERG